MLIAKKHATYNREMWAPKQHPSEVRIPDEFKPVVERASSVERVVSRRMLMMNKMLNKHTIADGLHLYPLQSFRFRRFAPAFANSCMLSS